MAAMAGGRHYRGGGIEKKGKGLTGMSDSGVIAGGVGV